MTRPRAEDGAVKTESVALLFPEIDEWCVQRGVEEEGPDGEDLLKAIVTLAVMESADAYEAVRYLEDVRGWPVDIDLVLVLHRVYGMLPKLVTDHVHKWVMASQTRFPAKVEDGVSFKIGKGPKAVNAQGTVVALISREARAIVAVGRDDVISVEAEEVTKVTPAEQLKQTNKK